MLIDPSGNVSMSSMRAGIAKQNRYKFNRTAAWDTFIYMGIKDFVEICIGGFDDRS